MSDSQYYQISRDDLSRFGGRGPAFVTFGEVMVRDTPADTERLERTRQVYLSMAGSEYTLAMGLSRLGVPSAFITRVPDNPYGWQVRDIAREQGLNTDHFVWAPKGEPIGRYLYELGRTPRPTTGWYQRMYSAASRLGAGMVDWSAALADCRGQTYFVFEMCDGYFRVCSSISRAYCCITDRTFSTESSAPSGSVSHG